MIQFTIFGTPIPQGSAKAFAVKGRAYITDSNKKLRPWRQQVSQTAVDEMEKQQVKMIERETAVRLTVVFYFSKPKSRKKDIHKTTRPDLSKLIRAAEDGISGIVFEDDSQVIEYGPCAKRFGIPERTEFCIVPIYGTSDIEPVGMEKQ